jgi:hypothetical protein
MVPGTVSVVDATADRLPFGDGSIDAAVASLADHVLRLEVGAISKAGSNIIVALNAVALKHLRRPARRA